MSKYTKLSIGATSSTLSPCVSSLCCCFSSWWCEIMICLHTFYLLRGTPLGENNQVFFLVVFVAVIGLFSSHKRGDTYCSVDRSVFALSFPARDGTASQHRRSLVVYRLRVTAAKTRRLSLAKPPLYCCCVPNNKSYSALTDRRKILGRFVL